MEDSLLFEYILLPPENSNSLSLSWCAICPHYQKPGTQEAPDKWVLHRVKLNRTKLSD